MMSAASSFGLGFRSSFEFRHSTIDIDAGLAMSVTDRTAAELLSALQARRVSSVELTRAYLDQIQKHDAKVKAFLLVDPDAALARAKEIDDRRGAGMPLASSRDCRSRSRMSFARKA